MMDVQRPIFLQGKVMTDNGTPPPESAVIELVCNGQPRPQGYTDTKGRFSFQLGQNQSMMADASYGAGNDMGTSMDRSGRSSQSSFPTAPGSRNYSERDLMGCELRANLPGYRSDPVNLSGRRVLDNPDLGTIFLHKLGNVEGFTYSLTTAAAPKDAKKALDKGVDAGKKGKFPDAEVQLQKAVELYPKFAVAWYELGRTQEAQNKLEDAQKSYQQAVQADERYISPYLQMAQIAMREKKWPEVLESTNRVIKLDPYSYPGAYYLNAVANLQEQKLDAAEKSARETIKLDRDHKFMKASHVLGVILAQKQDYAGALVEMKSYLAQRPDGSDADFVRKQIVELEKMTGAGASAQTAKPSSAPPPRQP
jgi:tetratricopeptide (TPR) repeat protein